MHKSTDPLSPQLRLVEKEIDSAFHSNYLVSLKFAQAAWYLLATVEDSAIIPILRKDVVSIHEVGMQVDHLLTNIQYPMVWLYKACRPGGKIPYTYSDITYDGAVSLLNLARSYGPFVVVFSYASRGLITLELDAKEIIAKHTFRKDTRYEAYSRLLKATIGNLSGTFDELYNIITIDRVKVSGDRFTYVSDRTLVEGVKSILEFYYKEIFQLPEAWEFSRYSLREYLDFAVTIGAFALIHMNFRILAAQLGCIGLGYVDSIRVFTAAELISSVVRYSNLTAKTVSSIVNDLTYGNQGIKNPDPALQPLIQLTKKEVALAPSIWMASAIERNFTVLLNKLPTERKIYAALVNQKEDMMRSQIMNELSKKPYRFFTGRLPQDDTLPDIDLAIISDSDEVCLLLELKWFIYPADIGEVITRSEELQKGVNQLIQISRGIRKEWKPFYETLNITTSYRFGYAVVSANWIGFEDVQDPNISIINQRHLVRKIQHEVLLLPVIQWLLNRDYLPTEGKEYEIVDDISEIGTWKLKWYGLKPLVQDEFLPL